MNFLKYIIILFIFFTTSIKADLNKNLIYKLEEGEKLIFIRHAYAPGGGDPSNVAIINLIEIASTGNSQDFGDLIKVGMVAGLSDSHGGLGGF